MGGRVQNKERKASESRRRNEAEGLKKDNRDKAIRVQKKRSQKSWISENYSYVLVAAGVLAFFIFLRMEPRGTTENLDSAEAPAIEDMYISDHNEGDSGYNLGSNTLFDGVSLAESRKIFKNYFNQQVLFPRCAAKKNKEALPENFNWQDSNPGCLNVSQIKNYAHQVGPSPLYLLLPTDSVLNLETKLTEPLFN